MTVIIWLLLLLLLSWPPVRALCLNYKVVMFQPQKGISPDLDSDTNCYVTMLLSPIPPFLSTARCPPGGETRSRPFSLSIANRHVPTQDHPPTRASPVSITAYQYSSLPDSDYVTSSHTLPSPRLPDYHRCSLAASKISSNVSLNCF